MSKSFFIFFMVLAWSGAVSAGTASSSTKIYECTGDDRVPPNHRLDPGNWLPEAMGLPDKPVARPPAVKISVYMEIQRDSAGNFTSALALFGTSGGAGRLSLGSSGAFPLHRYLEDFPEDPSRPNVMRTVLLAHSPNLLIGKGDLVGNFSGTAFSANATLMINDPSAGPVGNVRIFIDKILSSAVPISTGVPIDFRVLECHPAMPY